MVVSFGTQGKACACATEMAAALYSASLFTIQHTAKLSRIVSATAAHCNHISLILNSDFPRSRYNPPCLHQWRRQAATRVANSPSALRTGCESCSARRATSSAHSTICASGILRPTSSGSSAISSGRSFETTADIAHLWTRAILSRPTGRYVTEFRLLLSESR